MKAKKLVKPKLNSAAPQSKGDPPDNLHKKLVLGCVLAVVGIVVIALALIIIKPDADSSKITEVNDECSAKNDITFKCYKDELKKITEENGPESAMSLVKRQYESVPYVKSQCHQLVHLVGRYAVDKYKNIADTYAHGDQFCWSGYYHGALEEFATLKGYNYLLDHADSVCEPIAKQSLHSFYHYNCVHGMGHGFMFLKDGDLFVSLKACDSLTDSWERESCYGGVFMQNIMNEQTPDKDLNEHSKYLKADQPMYPCTAVEYKYKNQCYLMQTSYALQTVSYDFEKVFDMCANVDIDFRDTCYTSLGRDASGNSISDVEQTRTKCLLGQNHEARKYCVEGAAKDFVSYFHSDVQAKKFCASLPNELSGDCEGVVKSYYSSF